jgi:bifunctional non-homologous end joining protein LigD
MAGAAREARTSDRVVRLTSAERVLWPDDGITKGDLWDYYDAASSVLVPHLRDRPFTMKRFREGIRGSGFFQKQAPKGIPAWIPTRRFTTYPREGGSREVDFALVDSREALLWMVQFHCIDMNAWYSRIDKPDRPDFVLFDLDPPDDGFAAAAEVALLVHDELEGLGLDAYPKTSGAGGMHVLVPIARRSTFAETHEFAELLSKRLEQLHPGVVTTEWLKEKRQGVFLDYHQNGWGKTIASAYSVRPKPGAPVSTPLRWDELQEGVDDRAFTMAAVVERVEREGDLFEPVLHGRQQLGPALERLRHAAAEPGS